jgi:hypothetical protein
LAAPAADRMRERRAIEAAFEEFRGQVSARPQSATAAAAKDLLATRGNTSTSGSGSGSGSNGDDIQSGVGSVHRPFATLGYIELPREADAVLERAAKAVELKAAASAGSRGTVGSPSSAGVPASQVHMVR